MNWVEKYCWDAFTNSIQLIVEGLLSVLQNSNNSLTLLIFLISYLPFESDI